MPRSPLPPATPAGPAPDNLPPPNFDLPAPPPALPTLDVVAPPPPLPVFQMPIPSPFMPLPARLLPPPIPVFIFIGGRPPALWVHPLEFMPGSAKILAEKYTLYFEERCFHDKIEWIKFYKFGMHPSEWKWAILQFLVSTAITTGLGGIIGGVFGGVGGLQIGLITGAVIGATIGGIFVIGDGVCSLWNRAYQDHIAAKFDDKKVLSQLDLFVKADRLDDVIKYLIAGSYGSIMRYAFWSSMQLHHQHNYFRLSFKSHYEKKLDTLFALGNAYKRSTEHKFLNFFQKYFLRLYDNAFSRLYSHQRDLYFRFCNSVDDAPDGQFELFTRDHLSYSLHALNVGRWQYCIKVAIDFVFEFLGAEPEKHRPSPLLPPPPPPPSPSGETEAPAEGAASDSQNTVRRGAPLRVDSDSFDDRMITELCNEYRQRLSAEGELLNEEARMRLSAIYAGLEILARQTARRDSGTQTSLPARVQFQDQAIQTVSQQTAQPSQPRQMRRIGGPIYRMTAPYNPKTSTFRSVRKGKIPDPPPSPPINFGAAALPLGYAMGLPAATLASPALLPSQQPAAQQPIVQVFVQPAEPEPHLVHQRPLAMTAAAAGTAANQQRTIEEYLRMMELFPGQHVQRKHTGPHDAHWDLLSHLPIGPLLTRPLAHLRSEVSAMQRARSVPPPAVMQRLFPTPSQNSPEDVILNQEMIDMYRALYPAMRDIFERSSATTLIGTLRRFGTNFLRNPDDVDPARVLGAQNQMLLFFFLDPTLRPTPVMFFLRPILRVASIFTKLNDWGRDHEFKDLLKKFDENFCLCLEKKEATTPSEKLFFRCFHENKLIPFNALPAAKKNHFIHMFSSANAFPKIFQLMYRGLIDEIDALNHAMKEQVNQFQRGGTHDNREMMSDFFAVNCLAVFRIVGRMYYVRAFLEFYDEVARDTRNIFKMDFHGMFEELRRRFDTPHAHAHAQSPQESARIKDKLDKLSAFMKDMMKH